MASAAHFRKLHGAVTRKRLKPQIDESREQWLRGCPSQAPDVELSARRSRDPLRMATVRCHERPKAVRSLVVVDHESVAADAAHMGPKDRQCGRGANGRVDGIASGSKDIQTGERSQVMSGGNHSLFTQNQLPSPPKPLKALHGWPFPRYTAPQASRPIPMGCRYDSWRITMCTVGCRSLAPRALVQCAPSGVTCRAPSLSRCPRRFPDRRPPWRLERPGACAETFERARAQPSLPSVKISPEAPPYTPGDRAA